MLPTQQLRVMFLTLVAFTYLALARANVSEKAGTHEDGKLHPNSLRHHRLGQHTTHTQLHKQVLPKVSVAVAQKNVTLVPSVPFAVEEQQQATFSAPDTPEADANSDAEEQNDSQTDASSAVVHLRQNFAEVIQNRKNVQQLEQALAVDQSLVHESSVLIKLSSTQGGRQAAKNQLLKTQGLLKQTMEMVHDGRAAAVKGAHDMLNEAEVVRKAADALSDEAQEQLRLFTSNKAPVVGNDASNDANIQKADAFENATSQPVEDED